MSKKEASNSDTLQVDAGRRLINEQAVTIGLSGSCVLLECNSATEAGAVRDWLESLANTAIQHSSD